MIKKSLFLGILIIIGLALNVCAAENLTILSPTTALPVGASGTVSGNFSLDNTGTIDLTSIQFTPTQLTGSAYNISSSKITFSPTSYATLNSTETPLITFTVDLSGMNVYADLYSGVINSSASEAGNYEDFTLDLTVNPTDAMTVGSASVTATEGYSGDSSFTITNTGNSDLGTVTFSATELIGSGENISSTQVSFTPASTALNYGESKTINVTVNAPANTSSGSPYSGSIIADYGTGSVNNTLSVAVSGVNELITVTQSIAQAEIVRTSSSAKTTFKIKNDGTVPLTSISFTDSDLVLDENTSISSSQITVTGDSDLAIGEEKEVEITIQADPSYVIGTYNGNITINYGSGKTHPEPYTAVVRDAGARMGVPGSVIIGDGNPQKRGENITSSFNVSNAGVSGDPSITGITISSSANSKYKVEFSEDNSIFHSSLSIPGALNTGQSKEIFVRGFIPLDTDSSGSNNDIGDITIKSDQVNATISGLYINPEMMLEIEDLDVEVGSEKHSDVINGETVKDEAEADDTVKFSLKIGNKFSSSSDVDIEDINVKITIKDIDDEDDVEIESSEFDLDAGDSRSVDLEFDVPYKVESGTYDVQIEFEGKDTNRADHNGEWNIRLRVDKENHKLQITRATFGQSNLRCIRTTTFSVEVLNIGDSKEPEGVIKVKSLGLGIDDVVEYEFANSIDKDEIEFSKTYPIDAKNLPAGTYKVEVSVYYQETVQSDKSTVSLTVEDCTEDDIVVNDDDDQSDAIILEQDVEDILQDGGSVAEEISGDKKSFSQSGGYTFLLILANILVIALAVFLIFKFLIKPGRE